MARARYTLLSISNNGIVRVESDISYLGHFLYFYRHFKTNTISQQRITQGNGSYSLSYKCCVNQKSTASIHVELFWQSLNCARPSASLIVLNILIRTLHIMLDWFRDSNMMTIAGRKFTAVFPRSGVQFHVIKSNFIENIFFYSRGKCTLKMQKCFH